MGVYLIPVQKNDNLYFWLFGMRNHFYNLDIIDI